MSISFIYHHFVKKMVYKKISLHVVDISLFLSLSQHSPFIYMSVTVFMVHLSKRVYGKVKVEHSLPAYSLCAV